MVFLISSSAFVSLIVVMSHRGANEPADILFCFFFFFWYKTINHSFPNSLGSVRTKLRDLCEIYLQIFCVLCLLAVRVAYALQQHPADVLLYVLCTAELMARQLTFSSDCHLEVLTSVHRVDSVNASLYLSSYGVGVAGRAQSIINRFVI